MAGVDGSGKILKMKWRRRIAGKFCSVAHDPGGTRGWWSPSAYAIGWLRNALRYRLYASISHWTPVTVHRRRRL